jgi:HSP20 family molecular chaperone IbpA
MKIKKIFSSLMMFTITVINLLFLSANAVDARPCGSCISKSPWGDMGPIYNRHRHLAARNPIFDHMADIFTMPMNLNSLLQQHHRHVAASSSDATTSNNAYRQQQEHIRTFSPNYHITENETSMQISFDLPGVKAKDLSLMIQDGGKTLKVSGLRSYEARGEISRSTFEQYFSIDPTVLDMSQVDANLSDGVLTVSASKIAPFVEEDRNIPVLTNNKNAEEKEQHEVNQEMEVIDGNEGDELSEMVENGIEISKEEDI